MFKLTKRQNDIVNFIHAHIDEFGAPPTRAEIAKAMGFRSPNAAEDHLRALVKKGVIALTPGTSRGIRLLQNNKIPMITIEENDFQPPILNQGNIKDYYRLDSSLFKKRAHFMIPVFDDSMEKTGLIKGDLLVIHQTSQPENGQIVLGVWKNKPLVRTYLEQTNGLHLLPDSADFQSVSLNTTSTSFQIEGIVIGLIKRNFI